MLMDLNDPELAALAPRFAALEPRTRAAIAGVSPAALAMRPPQGGWSIAETLEHLIVGNASYFPPMEAAIARSRRQGRTTRAKRTTFFGRLLVGAMAETSTRKVPTSRKLEPRSVRANVTEEFLAGLARAGALMREADGTDLGAMMTSPILPIIRLNLGEAFELLVTHTERHLGQIERTRRSIGA
jgi:hypothetical protein